MTQHFSRRQFLKQIPMASAALAFPWSSPLFARAVSTPFPGKYKPDWDSLSRYQPPDWFRDAKFGIFLHWGVYSVPAHLTEWYPRLMYRRESPVFEWH
ncbi:MAG TPA: alpha-L-fucosidase, partial [Terriglobia bacterium]|nr:alpha-L-fucosidase [Terriglobia bacterium]